LTKVIGKGNVEFEYAFGKHVMFDPTRFDLVVHCGEFLIRSVEYTNVDIRLLTYFSLLSPPINKAGAC
jgi:hypothetical protein